jgi:site-specific recombinase
VEARELFVSALGGGVIVVLMTLSKTYVLHAGLAPLFLALAVWIVYAGGFLAMQACGFTLATKIPSFAATRLAQWIRDARSKNDARKFAGEVGLVVKSQIYGLAGNVIAVLAGAWILQRAFVVWPSLPGVFDNSYSVHTLEDLHPFRSPAVLLGALTGAELWASSICGGWFENFVVFRGIPEGIANHARLRRIFGAETARRYADRFLKHASGIATNISLGFFFAFVPIFGALGGLNLESKHVTIATTGATFAITRLGIDGNSSIIVPAVIGLALVAMMNFFVSFALAMVVAVRAQNVHRAWLWHFLRSIWRKPSKV